MADLRPSTKPRNFLARREQWRLLLLFATLGLVVFAMNTARKPQSWTWLLGQPADLTPAPPETGSGLPVPPPESGPDTSGPDASGLSAGQGPQAQAPTTSRPPVDPAALDAVLAEIRDDTIFRPSENEAWFALLAILNQTDADQLRRESTGPATFMQLNRQSDQYRGQLVTVRGTIVRALPAAVAPNDQGIERLYQTVLRPADHPKELMFVYCLSLPEGFPTGSNVSAQVEVTGFFFKRWAYRAQEAILSRPVVLAKTVRWTPAPPVAPGRPLDFGGLIALVVVAFCMSLAVVIYLYTRTRRKRPAEPPQPPRFDTLGEVEPHDGPEWDNL